MTRRVAYDVEPEQPEAPRLRDEAIWLREGAHHPDYRDKARAVAGAVAWNAYRHADPDAAAKLLRSERRMVEATLSALDRGARSRVAWVNYLSRISAIYEEVRAKTGARDLLRVFRAERAELRRLLAWAASLVSDEHAAWHAAHATYHARIEEVENDTD